MTLIIMKDLIKIGAKIHGHTFMPLAGTPYYKEPPGVLDKEIKIELSKFTSLGKLYGDWNKQEKIGWEVYKFISQHRSLSIF